MFRSRSPFSVSLQASLLLVLGLAITLALFVGVRSFESRKEENIFQQRANVRITAISEGIRGAIDALEITNRLFATVEPVSREQFQQFTQPLLQRYPYIQALNFHRLVPAAELPGYVDGMRKRYPGFTVTELVNGKPVPVRAKERYDIVDYLEPLAGNEAALGLDVSPNVHMAETLQAAIDSGRPAATDMLRLAQDDGLHRGFVVMMPVYRHGASLADVEGRRRAVIGDTAAVFRANDLIDRILRRGGFFQGRDIDISVYAGHVQQERDLAFRQGAAPRATQTAGWLPAWLFYDQSPTISQTFEVADKSWLVVVSAAPVWFSATNSGALLALIAGVMLSLLAAAFIDTVTARSQRVRRLVDQRTAELKQANELLVEDIAARERVEHALRLRQHAIESSANAIIIISAAAPDFVIEYVNPAFQRITGYDMEEVMGQCFRFLQSDDRDQPGIEEIRATLREQREGHVILRNYRKDGTLFWNDIYIAPVRDGSGEVSHFVVTQYDVTSIKRYEAELEFQANRDGLTGLANRNLLRDRLLQAIAYGSRYSHPIWVVFADLDRFKVINDTLGHRAGDLLLSKVGERLLTAVRESDTVARLGGDEFMLILPERIEERLTMGAMQRIMDALATPFTIEGHEFFMTCSVGVATYPADGEDADMLIKNAEIAMYRAKETGRNNFQFYTTAMNAQALERLHLERDLRNAVERGEFVLHYQPQVDLRTGCIVGMEALIRWRHPELGMVPPGRFIGLAEEAGLIVPIGIWVIRTACMQTKAWQDAGLGMLRVAVNLSARQFYQEELLQSVAAALEESGLAAEYLEIELTESLVMTDVDRATEILADLKALGVLLSIDDFGTGYSSLSYLKRFPIDVLKIDQSFVRDITVDPDDAAIVVLIISLAHSLRLKVIAEGVETYEQLAYLSDHDCDQMQGYYFSRPVPAEAFWQLLREGKCLPIDTETDMPVREKIIFS